MKASCTWGEAEDVCIELDGTELMLFEPPSKFKRFKDGIVSKGQIALSANDAIELASQLQAAAITAQELEEGYAKACDEDALKDQEIALHESGVLHYDDHDQHINRTNQG